MTRTGPTPAFHPIGALWNRILARSGRSVVFLTPEWQESWWTEFGNAAALRLLAVGPRDAPLGIAPLQLIGERLTFLGDTDLFDYHDFITDDRSFYPALLDAVEDEPWRTMELSSVPQWSPTFHLLPDAARRRGYAVRTEIEDVVPGIALPGSWDAYLAGLRKKDRHELRRKLRRLASAGEVNLRRADASTLDRDFALFREMMAESREEKRTFLSPERQAFFERIVHRMEETGRLRLLLLDIDGDPAAAVLAFDDGDQRMLYNSGYRHAYAHLAVGLMLKALCVRDAIESGLRYFDLLRGSEPYKYHLGAEDGAVHRITVSR